MLIAIFSIFIYFIFFELVEPQYIHLKNIDYNYIEDHMRCLTPLGSEERGFIINTPEELQILEESKNAPFCDGIELPIIDFGTKTLLGRTTISCGCSSTSSRGVYRDDKEKEIIYSIVIKSAGSCELAGTNGNWILIDKFPVDYKVRFETKYIGNAC